MRISKSAVKKLVRESSDVVLDDKAAEALARILERKAREIAEHAVANAKKRRREVILKEDIEDYSIKNG